MNKEPTIKIFQSYYFDPGFLLKNDLFEPVQVDNFNKPITGISSFENTGDNISHKGILYAGHATMYWIWKNHKNYDYIGFSDYRRFLDFGQNGFRNIDIKGKIDEEVNQNFKINKNYIMNILENYDVITTPIDLINQSLYQNFIDINSTPVIDYAIEYIKNFQPNYYESAMEIIYGNEARWYHVFIATNEIFDKYCNFVFPVCDYIESKMDMGQFKGRLSRILGFLCEGLWMIFVHKLAKENFRIFYAGHATINVFSPTDREKICAEYETNHNIKFNNIDEFIEYLDMENAKLNEENDLLRHTIYQTIQTDKLAHKFFRLQRNFRQLEANHRELIEKYYEQLHEQKSINKLHKDRDIIYTNKKFKNDKDLLCKIIDGALLDEELSPKFFRLQGYFRDLEAKHKELTEKYNALLEKKF